MYYGLSLRFQLFGDSDIRTNATCTLHGISKADYLSALLHTQLVNLHFGPDLTWTASKDSEPGLSGPCSSGGDHISDLVCELVNRIHLNISCGSNTLLQSESYCAPGSPDYSEALKRFSLAYYSIVLNAVVLNLELGFSRTTPRLSISGKEQSLSISACRSFLAEPMLEYGNRNHIAIFLGLCCHSLRHQLRYGDA